MDCEIIFENIKNFSDEIDLLICLLSSKSGPQETILDEEDLDYIIENLDLYGSIVGNFFQELSQINHDFEKITQKVVDSFSSTLDISLAMRQGEDYNDRYNLLDSFDKLKSANLLLYRSFKIHGSLNPQKKLLENIQKVKWN